MHTPIQIKTTFEHREDAAKLARQLLEKRLVACAQIQGPVESLYWWQGAIARENKYVLLVKTFDSLYAKVEKLISREHPYEVPEILAEPILHVGEGYLHWLREELLR